MIWIRVFFLLMALAWAAHLMLFITGALYPSGWTIGAALAGCILLSLEWAFAERVR